MYPFEIRSGRDRDGLYMARAGDRTTRAVIGKARAEALTPEQRSEIARSDAAARWTPDDAPMAVD